MKFTTSRRGDQAGSANSAADRCTPPLLFHSYLLYMEGVVVAFARIRPRRPNSRANLRGKYSEGGRHGSTRPACASSPLCVPATRSLTSSWLSRGQGTRETEANRDRASHTPPRFPLTPQTLHGTQHSPRRWYNLSDRVQRHYRCAAVGRTAAVASRVGTAGDMPPATPESVLAQSS
ncbi:hypothetical protein BV25DRAFT_405177 [Artomyces pyxidatus]|uniref:Uncharacterized protein n=1 Tax=Artomyces pyxidatus TaxID=48021 RepID=A0ACB8T6B8_9AGAM|nr:hypothetical protein BV25DRAFT_405177 [Artomyces pyxidatus]